MKRKTKEKPMSPIHTPVASPSGRGQPMSSTNQISQELPSTRKKMITRVVYGFFMIVAFAGIIYAGHIYVWLMVVVFQTLLFRELVNVRYRAAAEKNIPWFRSLQWSWFAVAMLYNYGDSLYIFFETQEGSAIPGFVAKYVRYHPWISFSLYVMIFVMTVVSFKKGYYKYQMGQMTWTLVTLALIVFQMKYILVNLINGLYWVLFPASLVICNDICAYFCGMLLGKKFIKHHFLRLSPKKTWEGFIGAFFFTLIFGFFVSRLLARFSWLVCPVTELELLPGPLLCEIPDVFRLENYIIPEQISHYIGISSLDLLPIQLHSFVFSVFTSFVAPFGGFLASAIKRTYQIKDFDSIIPGHGGVMDRMDCQLITALFVGVYYGTFIRPPSITVAMIVKLVEKLSYEDQLKLLQILQETIGNTLQFDM